MSSRSCWQEDMLDMSMKRHDSPGIHTALIDVQGGPSAEPHCHLDKLTALGGSSVAIGLSHVAGPIVLWWGRGA